MPTSQRVLIRRETSSKPPSTFSKRRKFDDSDSIHNSTSSHDDDYNTFTMTHTSLNDTKLCGTHKLITLQSAQYAIHLVSEFMRETAPPQAQDDKQKQQQQRQKKTSSSSNNNVTFTKDLFDPLWQRLKDQGGGGISTTTRNNCSWRVNKSNNNFIVDPLSSSRNWVYVPPKSTITKQLDGIKSATNKKGSTSSNNNQSKYKLGKDYYLSEEQVVLNVMEDISTLDEVFDLYAMNAHCFSSIIPILDKAVTYNLKYKDAYASWNSDGDYDHSDTDRKQRKTNLPLDHHKSKSGYKKRKSPRGVGGSRAVYNKDDGYEYYDPNKWEKAGMDDNCSDDDDDGNKDECDACGEGGELICCDGCDNAYHEECLGVNVDTLPDPWHCPHCASDSESDGKSGEKIRANEVNETTCLPSDHSDSADAASTSADVKMPGISADTTVKPCDESNLLGVTPKVNMPLEILDSDNIWNVAKVIRVKKSKSECHVTIRYGGWGSDWDEEMSWPNERLARIFTYTKCAKCFVALLDSKRVESSSRSVKNWSNLWPCKVHFRMPVPNDDDAREFLQHDDMSKVYCEPYMPALLPVDVQQALLFEGGQWMDVSKVKPWKDMYTNDDTVTSPTTNNCVIVNNILSSDNQLGSSSYHITVNFSQAYQKAASDWMTAKLPPNAVQKGALLKQEYLVHNIGGDVINGVRYSGAFPLEKNGINYKSEDKKKEATEAPIAPPPTLPPPIPITDMAYPDQGVRRLPGSNRWAGILNVSGNDIFLGSYTSQSEAASAVKQAQLGGKSRQYDPNAGRLSDLLNTPIEAIVSAFEETQQGDQRLSSPPRFRIQDWTAQHSKHVQHLNSSEFSFMVQVKSDNVNACNKKRKKGKPKRLVLPTT